MGETMVSQPVMDEMAETQENAEAMRAEEEQLLEDLRREMRENEETLAKLRPKLIEQETLEEELQTLRQERWQLQQVGELEKLKELAASSAESETSTAAQGVTAQAETALLEMMDLERELDAEMEHLRQQFETAKQSEETFKLAKEKLLNELNDFAIDNVEDDVTIEEMEAGH